MTTQTDKIATDPNTSWVTRQPNPQARTTSDEAKRDNIVRIVLGVTLPVLLLVSWEISAQAGWIDARFFSHPSAVAAKASEDIRSGLLWSELRITLFRLLVGYITGAVVGIAVGLAMSQSKVLRWTLEPIIRALYVVPKLALLPLFLLIFGLGELPILILIALGTFYIVAFTTLSAAMMIPTAYHEVARSYGLSRGQRFRWVIVQSSLPQIVASLRLASGYAMLLVIGIEFVNASVGLGHYTWHAWQVFVPDRMYVGVVTVSIVGVVFSALIALLGSRLVRWADDEYGQQR